MILMVLFCIYLNLYIYIYIYIVFVCFLLEFLSIHCKSTETGGVLQPPIIIIIIIPGVTSLILATHSFHLPPAMYLDPRSNILYPGYSFLSPTSSYVLGSQG